jgi:predicted TIM-barrel fold metal-dependent hydrolase
MEALLPHLGNIRYGSYARPAFMAAKEFYGFDDINEGNYKALSERMAAANRPGIYRRVLRERCKIRVALTQSGRTDYDLDLLLPIMWVDEYAAIRTKKEIEKRAAKLGGGVRALDDYVDLTRKGIEKWMSEGVVGLKMWTQPYGEPDRGRAVALYDSLMRAEKKQLPEWGPLRTYITDAMLDMASELGLVVAVHTGMWGDFRTLDPKHMIPVITRHPDTKFDLYHMGMPWVRDAGVIGKNFPNVWLNLCWSHIVSPRMTCSALDEWVDLVPMNKIIAFGGDYEKPVEKVYGHLVMARENIARVLGGRVSDGLMTEGEAIDVARKWFYHNPKGLYRLRI